MSWFSSEFNSIFKFRENLPLILNKYMTDCRQSRKVIIKKQNLLKNHFWRNSSKRDKIHFEILQNSKATKCLQETKGHQAKNVPAVTAKKTIFPWPGISLYYRLRVSGVRYPNHPHFFYPCTRGMIVCYRPRGCKIIYKGCMIIIVPYLM